MTGKKRKRSRLDDLLVSRNLAPSRERAAALIMSGSVRVNGIPCDKPGSPIDITSGLEVLQDEAYVGRGAFKLDGALVRFGLDLKDRICADVGASTGGFTQVMLESGAAKVFAIDVGYGELDWKLRSDARVEVMERTNARYIDRLPSPIQFVSIDVSFISIRLLLPVIKGWLDNKFDIVALIKPQFEAKRKEVESGGIVGDIVVRHNVIREILHFAMELNFSVCGLVESSIKGRKGNQEYLVWLSDPTYSSKNAEELIANLNEE